MSRTYPGHDFPPDFARIVHTRSEGSPLFVADVLRWLGTQGVIAERDGRWSLVRPVPEVDHELPSSVRSMIERKIAQVDDADRRLLGAAAVQGAEFDSATVAAALKADVADVEEQLIVLDKVYAFVRRTEDATFPDRSQAVRYRFVHALYQNVLAAALAPTRRAAWSRTAAEFLEARHGTRAPEIAGTLATLFEAGRQPERAAAWYGLAAQRAMAVFAYAEAEELATRGLAQGDLVENAAAHVGDRAAASPRARRDQPGAARVRRPRDGQQHGARPRPLRRDRRDAIAHAGALGARALQHRARPARRRRRRSARRCCRSAARAAIARSRCAGTWCTWGCSRIAERWPRRSRTTRARPR